MTPSEYQNFAGRTENNDYDGIYRRLNDVHVLRLVHAAQGLCTETGEFTDTLKKHLFYGKPLDIVNLGEEIGDIMWYVSQACNALGIDLENVMIKNIEKLKARYPGRFEEEQALNRDLEQEQAILKGEDK